MSHRITYFPFAGRADPVRIAAFIGGVELEDVRVPGKEFMQMKVSGQLPLGSLPVLDLPDGTRVGQCVAMLRYVAALGSSDTLYPSDPLTALVVDSVLDTFNDTLSKVFMPTIREQDPEKKRAMREAFSAGPLRTCLGYVEGLAETYGGDGPFITGSELTIADLYAGVSLGHYFSGNVDFLDVSVIEAFPRMAALRDAYAVNDKVVAYRNTL
ncbi:MAG: glutathione S-transferase [Kiritimatiellia bacterium]|jgi:glutathione S-transferase